MTEEKEKEPEYETIDVIVQCSNCYSVWRVEHEVQKGERPAFGADPLKCPLCFDESE